MVMNKTENKAYFLNSCILKLIKLVTRSGKPINTYSDESCCAPKAANIKI